MLGMPWNTMENRWNPHETGMVRGAAFVHMIGSLWCLWLFVHSCGRCFLAFECCFSLAVFGKASCPCYSKLRSIATFRRSWPDKTRWSDWWLLSATTLLTTSSPQTARPLQSWTTPMSWKLSKSQSGSICTSNSKHKRNSPCRMRWCFGALFKQRPLRSNLWRRPCIHKPWMTSCP